MCTRRPDTPGKFMTYQGMYTRRPDTPGKKKQKLRKIENFLKKKESYLQAWCDNIKNDCAFYVLLYEVRCVVGKYLRMSCLQFMYCCTSDILHELPHYVRKTTAVLIFHEVHL